MPTSDHPTLQPVGDGVFATPPAPLPYGQDLQVRAFVLQRPAGNLVIYNAPGLTAAAEDVDRLGGAVRQILGHGHEAMFGPQRISAPLHVHERDEAETARSMPVDGTFAHRHTLDGDVEIVPTPGHTPGATAVLFDSGAHRYLFTGDTLWDDHGRWSAVVLGGSDRAAYLESLAVLRDLDFDVLVPWGAVAGAPATGWTDRRQARARIDAVIARVRAGGRS
ncbi:MBL fold metallo-hydrolase [Pseudonocardia broussonetiae]|uniref:MBL fold metallo-hydrolase n=1 Tax=Pseudonocardia broussonetiae TaxID=2736640 RepID=A0A6M6JN19_9PSEU|nr:MBL fold metallo-hydrolase [Pseudonocardia broussonetiae]QJY48022.1 MBL fold metallo-hydrolase [Pseudonocardia broussonetiae]